MIDLDELNDRLESLTMPHYWGMVDRALCVDGVERAVS